MAENLLADTIDMHIHTAPDVHERSVTDIQAAKYAKAAGMKAIMIKNHETITSDRAQIASDIAGFPVFGGVALNYSVGGLNIHAVRAAIDMGAKAIWMPTVHAGQFLKDAKSVPSLAKRIPEGLKGIVIIDHKGKLHPDLPPILDKIAEFDLILATGHIGKDETFPLVDGALKAGVRKIVVTHALAHFLDYTIDDLRKLASMGAYIEHCFVLTTKQVADPLPISVISDAIKSVGPKNSIISTDGGQFINPEPTKMFAQFISDLLDQGINPREINLMARKNPAVLLGLDG